MAPEGKIPQGKGMFLWLLHRLCNDNGGAEGLVNILLAEGYQWVSVKVQDGIYPFTGYKTNGYPQQDLLAEFVPQCSLQGLEFHAWGYVYGKNWLLQSQVDKEATVTLQMIEKWKPLSFMINDEGENRGDRVHLADSYVRQVRSGMAVSGDTIPDIPLGMSSHRFPESHRAVPYSAYAPYIEFWAPQVYWQADTRPDGSVQQLWKSMEQYKKIRELPFVPAGTVYPHGSWLPTTGQLTLFNDECKQNENILGVNYWEYHYLCQEPGLRAHMAAFDWKVDAPEPPEPPPSGGTYEEGYKKGLEDGKIIGKNDAKDVSGKAIDKLYT